MRYTYFNLSSLSLALRASQLAAFGTLSLCAALTVSGCGGGGATTDQPPGAAASVNALRALPENFATRKAVAYSPFRSSNRDTETITDAMVKQDLDLLVQAGIGAIRLFDSSEKVAFRTLRLIRANNMDIKVMLGMYVNTFEYETDAVKRAAVQAGNEDELARGVALANSYTDIISAVSVGNETLVSWSFVPISTSTLASYLKRVRDQIQQPVTTDDNWAPFAGQGRNAAEQVSDVLRQIDFVSMHTYSHEDAFFSNFSDTDFNPDWDWQQTAVTDTTKRAAAMMDAAVGKTKKDFAAVRSFLDKSGRASLPIIIGETGWKATDPSGTGRYKFLAGAANQKMYYSRLLEWAAASRTNGGPKSIIYFEAFDEPWKGSDDKWGLFNVQRQARCAAQFLKSVATWAKDSASCEESNATYYIPPLLQAKVTTPTYILNSEAVSGWPAGLRTDAFSGTTVEYTFAKGDSDPADSAVTLTASNYILLSSYRPTAENYGWGMLYQSAANPPVSSNLSNFANGSINFSIKSGYVGKLRIGISSDTELGSVVEANVMISKDKYGYCNDATKWCAVSIPLKDFVAANPLLDLRYVLTRFAIADIWSETGNTARSGMPSISLDNIYWKQ